MGKYSEAQVYITKCSHPNHLGLKYVGLDTKKDPNYLGSSVVLKWWINFIGRNYFYKEVIDTVTGGMDECCRVEQKYIVSHNAVKDPNYLNMNGGTPMSDNNKNNLNMEYLILPISNASDKLLSIISNEVKCHLPHFDQSRHQMVSSIINLLVFGYLKYGQETFEYDKYRSYGSCTAHDTQAVITSLSRLGYIDATYESITITPKLVDEIPVDLDYSDFESTLREN